MEQFERMKELLNEARGYFSADEEPLKTIMGSFDGSILGEKTLRNIIFVATNRRLILYGQNCFETGIEEVSYPDIKSISSVKGRIFYKLIVNTSERLITLHWIPKNHDVEGFIATVEQQMNQN